jgi:hypothetical protein
MFRLVWMSLVMKQTNHFTLDRFVDKIFAQRNPSIILQQAQHHAVPFLNGTPCHRTNLISTGDRIDYRPKR